MDRWEERSLRTSLLVVAVVGTCYALGSTLSYIWFNANGAGASFFPAAGVTVAALILLQRQLWPIVLITAFATEVALDLAHDLSLAESLGYGLANTTEPLVGALVALRLAGEAIDLGRVRGLAAFVAGAVVTGPAAGAVIGATTAVLANEEIGWGRFALQWWVGDGVGVIVVGGLALAWLGRPGSAQRLRHPVEASLLVPLAMASTVLLFWFERPVFTVMPLLALLWISFRVGTRGVALLGTGVAFTAAHATAEGHSLWVTLGVSPLDGLAYLQWLVGSLTITGYALAATIREREDAVLGAAVERAARERAEEEAAVGRERARLLDSEQRARREAELLQRVTSRLANEIDPRTLAAVIARETREAFGARTCIVATTGPRGTLVLREVDGYPEQLRASIDALLDRDADIPLVRAFRTGRMCAFETRREGTAAFRDLGALPYPFEAVVAAPLVLDGVPQGAVAWGWRHERHLDERFKRLAHAVADQCSIALERGRIQSLEHRVAVQLQRALLPSSLVANDDVEVGAEYAPSQDELTVGGDWYDVALFDEHRIGFSIGDVVGRGLSAAAAMGQLRSAAAALAPTASPGEVLELLSRFAERTPGAAFSTACFADLQLDTGLLRYACAGHPPPLLVTPDGQVELLRGGRSVPLCAADGPRAEAQRVIEPGSLVVVYTDGLVERRGHPIDEGIARLAQALASNSGLEAGLLASRLMGELLDDQEADDAAILCLRYAPVAAPLRMAAPATREQLRSVRGVLRRWLARQGVGEIETGALLLAAGEALANAVEHGANGASGSTLELRAHLADGDVVLDIEDQGAWRVPRDDAGRGRGLPLMEALCDRVDVVPGASGTRVRLVKRVHEKMLV